MRVGGVVGLYLHAGAKAGTGKYTLRFVSPLTGKRRDMGLGAYPAMGLAQVRATALEAQQLIAQRTDPIDHRKQQQFVDRRESETPTFSQAAERVFDSIAPGFRNEKHKAQWIGTLRTYAIPYIGRQRVDLLTTANFGHLLAHIWLEKPETAGRVKQRCDRVMTWCVANQYAPTNPVSSVTALLPKQTPKHERVVHHPSVPWRDLPKVAARLLLSKKLRHGKQALLFAILTAARSGEVRGAKWHEFDLANRVWSLTAERMKAKRPHRVALSDQAIAILEYRARNHLGGEFVFSTRKDVKMSDMTMTKVLRDNNVASDGEYPKLCV